MFTDAATIAGSPPQLDALKLARAERETLDAPRLSYDVFSRALFTLVDVLYGRRRSPAKLYVLELLARVPYQAWERACYRAVTRLHRQPAFVDRIYERMIETRAQQDNERWHLLVLAELLRNDSVPLGTVRYRVLPWLMAGPWHIVSWLLFLLRPQWSYSLNANFEDHAEHEYMLYVYETPTLSQKPWCTRLRDTDQGDHATVADVLRQIGHDERVHKAESLVNRCHGRVGNLTSYEDQWLAA